MSIIVGVDEVGRGCWAGPLVAAAVVLRQPIAGLTDSKLLSRKRRQDLASEIQLTAAYGVGWVWPEQIDLLGLTAATTQAMAQAVSQIVDAYDQIIVDGNFNYLAAEPQATALIKADLTIPAVSAASIVAKVARDAYMAEQAVKYPVYRFEKHVGYGTKLHLDALKRYGACEIHRRSYKPIKAFLV